MSQPEDTSPAADESVGSTPRAPDEHHAGLWSELVRRADALTAALTAGHGDRDAHRLVTFLRGDVLPHLEAEERVLYEAARQVGAHDLVATLEVDHRFLLDLVAQIEKADTALEAALSARALVVLFALRMEKEDTVVLSALTEAGADVQGLLDRMIVTMASDYDSRFTYL